MIDFRSDTVTRPTQEMLAFMMASEVGDDVFGDDPTVNKLQEFAAEMFGFEDSLFCSSGTQTNQIAINVHCRPGDEVICHEESHIYKYEGGGIARNSGTSVRLLRGNRGMLKAENVKEWINPDNVHLPVTSLVSLEDTTNRGGGGIYDFEEIKKIKKVCESHNIPLHLDGARVFNALVETQIDYKKYGEQEALRKVKQKYMDDFAKTKDLHLFLGTTKRFHFTGKNPFVIIGTFTPKIETQTKLDLF